MMTHRIHTLCIGVDLAWFGGSKGKRDTQNDGVTIIGLENDEIFLDAMRVPLPNRDPSADVIAQKITEVVKRHAPKRVVIAIDAPLSPDPRDFVRTPLPKKGQVKLRGCERAMSQGFSRFDGAAVSGRWRPRVQPGWPIPQRAQNVVNHLCGGKYQLFRSGIESKDFVIIECFPAEAIWSAKVLGQFMGKTADSEKKYKKCKSYDVTSNQIIEFACTPLKGILAVTGTAIEKQDKVIQDAKSWLEQNQPLKCGKPFDDVVDSMICSASALAFINRAAHMWHNPNVSREPEPFDDGNIIGPGMLQNLEQRVCPGLRNVE